MTTSWTNLPKRSVNLILNFDDNLNFDDALNGVNSATSWTFTTKSS